MDIIFDVDGTLMDIEHRRHFVQGNKKDWKSFNTNMKYDRPFDDIAKLMISLIKGGNDIIICSGRNERHRDITFEQITNILMPPNLLKHDYMEHWYKYGTIKSMRNDNGYTTITEIPIYMRANDDYRPDHEVKLDLLTQMREEDCRDPEMAIDDRKCVVDMWRANGVRCLQVCEGDF